MYVNEKSSQSYTNSHYLQLCRDTDFSFHTPLLSTYYKPSWSWRVTAKDLKKWINSACLWDFYKVMAAVWYERGAISIWGVERSFLMEVSPAHCQFPFTKCQGNSPVIVSATEMPLHLPSSISAPHPPTATENFCNRKPACTSRRQFQRAS